MIRRQLTVAHWRTLSGQGPAPPVKIRLAGDSMAPLIRRDRDRVTIAPMDRPPQVGDIVLFPRRDQFVLHRVTRVEGDRALTLGDGLLAPDGWTHQRHLWGRAVKVERGPITIRPDKASWRALWRVWHFLMPLRVLWRKMRRMYGRIGRAVVRGWR